MTASDELLVVHAKQGVSGREELGVEHHFDSVGGVVEQFAPSQGIQDFIVTIVYDIVCGDGR